MSGTRSRRKTVGIQVKCGVRERGKNAGVKVSIVKFKKWGDFCGVFRYKLVILTANKITNSIPCDRGEESLSSCINR